MIDTFDDRAYEKARLHGRVQFRDGFSLKDYPIDYTPDEIEAWHRGWFEEKAEIENR